MHERLKLVDEARYIIKDSLVSSALESLDGLCVAVDTETNSLDPLLSTSKLCLLQLESNDKIVIFHLLALNEESKFKISQFLQRDDKIYILQNAKFDLKWLRYHLKVRRMKRVFCTLLASKLIACGVDLNHGHGLNNLILLNFGVEIEKETRMSDWTKIDLTPKQLRYAATDVTFLAPLREKQKTKLQDLGLNITAGIEFNCIPATAKMELNGAAFNFDRWMRVAMRHLKLEQMLKYKISDMLNPVPSLFADIRPTFKITDKEIIKFLKANNIEVPQKFSPTKKDDYGKSVLIDTLAIEHLEKVAHQHPVIPFIIRHASVKKARTSYGEEWAKFIHPVTGRVHPDFNQLGAETGRFTVSRPNLQQIPQSNLYRRCFNSAEGRSLIWGDYSQMELRILAEFSQDENMMKAFREELDLHTFTASLVFNVPYHKVSENKILRIRAKNLNFGIVYGIGAKRFAENADISLSEAESIIKNYFKTYPKVEQWLEWARNEAIRYRRSRTLSGRLMKHTFPEDNNQLIALAGRNGMNMPIQGSNADITKIAMAKIHNECEGLLDLSNVVHDEAISECDDDKLTIGESEMKRCLVSAGEELMKHVPVKVDMKVDKKWSK
jgi:DNA polymerase-1